MNSTRKTIVLVDDNEANLVQGRNILRTFYQVLSAPSAAKLFEALEKIIPDLILLDIEMPEMNGYEAIKKLKSDDRFKDIPVIFLTALDTESNELEGFELGAVDYVRKPFSPPLLLKRIEKELMIVERERELLDAQTILKQYSENLEGIVQQKTEAIMELQNSVLSTVADLVEFRDKLTGGHVVRTCQYLQAMTEEMIRKEVYNDEVSTWDKNYFLSSAQLHDVGKIAITDLILNKPDKLTNEEFDIMKGHVTAGVDAIDRIMSNTQEHSFLKHALHITGTHHEKWDGSGYPIGLKGNDIPLEGRLMAIADVYDALISERPYKKAFTHEEACRIIEEGSATQFDPVLVDVFRGIEDEFEKIALANKD